MTRGLTGDLGTMPLKDLVVYLGNRRASGTLDLEGARPDGAPVRKRVLLREGFVVHASSNQPREYFGQFLINMGQLDEQQFLRVYQEQQQTGVSLGLLLSTAGGLSEATVVNALSLKFRETLLDAFGWAEGTFSFLPDDTPAQPPGLDVTVDLLDVHREGEFRDNAWQAIRAVFPSGRVRLRLDESKLPELPTADSLDARLVALVREDLTVDEMVLRLHATDWFVYQRLYALYRLDAVQPVVEPRGRTPTPLQPGPVLGSEPPAEEVLQAARAFLDAGQLRDGEALARRAHEMAPGPASATLLKEAEQRLLAHLRAELLAPPRVATLKVPPSHLRQLPLSAPERYLLSRVDGHRSVAAIVHVSPLGELDALRYLEGFRSAGLLEVVPMPPQDDSL